MFGFKIQIIKWMTKKAIPCITEDFKAIKLKTQKDPENKTKIIN